MNNYYDCPALFCKDNKDGKCTTSEFGKCENIKYFYAGHNKAIFDMCLINRGDDTAIDILTMMSYARQKAIDDFVKTILPRLTDAIYPKDVQSMTNLINDVAEELKGE